MADPAPIPLRIESVTTGEKGRCFTGTVPAIATSSSLWGYGASGEAVRPIMALVVASAQEARPLIENLRSGCKAVLKGPVLPSDGIAVEFMRSAGYLWSPPQPLPAEDAVAHHIYLPEMFGFIPPTINETTVSFVVMPAEQDITDVLALHVAEIPSTLAHVRELGYPPRDLANIGVDERFAGLAAIWASHLQRRTIWAVPQRLAFRVQLLLACLKQGIVTMGDRELQCRRFSNDRTWWNSGKVDFESVVHPDLGMHAGLATIAQGKFLADVLALEVGKFDAMRRGKPAGKAA